MRFLERLSDVILSNDNKVLRNLIVILPNVRARVFLNNYIKEKAQKAIYLPISFSSAELMEKLSGLKSAEDFHLLSRLYNAYPHESEELTFETFMQWGVSVLQDFKEIDHQLVDTNSMFTQLQDIRNIEFWNPSDGELSEFQKKYLRFCQKLKPIYDSFCQEMEKDGLAHIGFMERRAMQKLSSESFPTDSKFIIAGFNALTKAEEEIFKYINENFETEFYWDYDKFYLENELHEAGFFARKNKDRFHGAIEWISDSFSESKEINVFNCSTSYEQSYVVHEILKEKKQADQMATAVILPDESLMIPILQNLPSNIEDINVTMGYPLSHSPYYSMFEDLFQLVFNARIRGENESFYYKDVFRLINSEGLKEMMSDDFKKEIQGFTQNSLKNNQVYINRDSFLSLTTNLFKYKEVFISSKSSFSELLNSFKDIIYNLDKNALDQKSSELKIKREFLLHHFEVIAQVQDMIDSLEEDLDLKTVHKIWRHYSRLSKVQFTGEPLKGLQIMGLLESRNLDFDHVIILNVNEGSLPADKRYGSLLPNDLKLKHGMHLHREKDAVIAYHFYRILQRAKRVDLLFSSQTENMGGGEKSRFLVQLEKEIPEYNSRTRIVNQTALSSIPIQSPVSHAIEKTDFLKSLIKKKFSTGLSPTSISTFIRCPKDFYFLELAGLKYRDEMVESVEANILGSAIHDTLEMLYKPHVGSVLNKEIIEGMKSSLETTLKNAFSEQINPDYLMSGRNLLDYRMAERVLLRFLEKEMVYVSRHKVELIALETRVEKDYELELDDEIIPLKIKGFVDRIERKDGTLHLIDYKTGKIENYDLSVKEMEQSLQGKDKVLQLMIYAMLYSDGNEDLISSVSPLKRYDTDYLPVSISRESILKPELILEFESMILEFAKGMLIEDDEFQHKEDSKYCKYC